MLRTIELLGDRGVKKQREKVLFFQNAILADNDEC